MKAKKSKILITIAFTIVCSIFIVFVILDTLGKTNSTEEEETTTTSTTVEVADEDLDSSYDEATATIITLNGSSANISGSGASVSGTTITISEPGTYVVSGTLNDGMIYVSDQSKGLVRIVLKNATITNTSGPAIHCVKARKLLLILDEGTTNTLSDGSSYATNEELTDEPVATIFSKTDVTINGQGTLVINGNYNNGITSKDNLLLVSGTYQITAVNDGIRGRDSITILDGDYTIKAGNDGMKSNNDTDDTVGWISIENGNFTITADYDGIQAESTLTLLDGEFNIVCGDGSSSVSSYSNSNNDRFNNNTTTTTTDDDTSDSFKGLKAGGNITISGGTFTLDCKDDTVHSNANVTISNASLTLSSGDDGIHADEDLIINSGTIDILTSYEGLEGNNITIYDGTINIIASDDGMNAAGGDNSGSGGTFGMDSFGQAGDNAITIEGGTIYVSASGDGIDSNGDIYLNGGTVYVDGPTSGADSAVDHDGEFLITGGSIIASGSSGMVEAPDSGSTQPSIVLYYSQTQSANTTITIKDSSGNTLGTFTPSKQYGCVIISTPEMTSGSSYSIYSNDELLTTITLSSMVTSISDTGSSVSGNGMNTPGGGGGQNNQNGNGGGRP